MQSLMNKLVRVKAWIRWQLRYGWECLSAEMQPMRTNSPFEPLVFHEVWRCKRTGELRTHIQTWEVDRGCV